LFFQQAANALQQLQILFKAETIFMGHFKINLPDNRVSDVRYGKVRKLELPFRWLFGKAVLIKQAISLGFIRLPKAIASTIFSKPMMAGGFRTRMNVFR
jgi:hypothetical protein